MLNLGYKLGTFIKYRYNLIYAFVFAMLYEIDICSLIYLFIYVGKNFIVGWVICNVCKFINYYINLEV